MSTRAGDPLSTKDDPTLADPLAAPFHEAHHAELTEAQAEAALSRRQYRGWVRRRLVTSPTFMIGTIVVAFWVLMAVGWRWIAPHDPFEVTSDYLVAPNAEHWAGTDELGRDVFSRVLAGSAPVLTIAPIATLLAITAGTLIGLAAGFYRGVLDDLLMRTVDAFLAFPGIIIAVMVLGLLGSSVLNVILIIAIFFAPLIARTVRSATLGEREKEYVGAARLRGERGPYIMIREILPNITGPIIVEGTVRLGYAVFTAATLSFLGLGLQPPSPDWGLTIASERTYVQIASWTVLAPAFALASLVVGVNLIADGLRRALQD
jgi:peptide/nickel transport system permease protein